MKKALSLVLLSSIVGSASALPELKLDDYLKNPYVCAAGGAAIALGCGELTKGTIKRNESSKEIQHEVAENMYTAMWIAVFKRAVKNEQIDLARVALKGIAGFAGDKLAAIIHDKVESSISLGGAAVNKTATRAISGEVVDMAVDHFCKSSKK